MRPAEVTDEAATGQEMLARDPAYTRPQSSDSASHDDRQKIPLLISGRFRCA